MMVPSLFGCSLLSLFFVALRTSSSGTLWLLHGVVKAVDFVLEDVEATRLECEFVCIVSHAALAASVESYVAMDRKVRLQYSFSTTQFFCTS